VGIKKYRLTVKTKKRLKRVNVPAKGKCSKEWVNVQGGVNARRSFKYAGGSR